jgi:hypothetical protein
MSVPLDRLYDHLDCLCNRDSVIYRFYPHGSKNLENLLNLKYQTWIEIMTLPMVICNDQEPLNFEFYKNLDDWGNKSQSHLEYVDFAKKLNLRAVKAQNGYDCTVLVHSERNSEQLKLYESCGFIGAHWWSHAAIACDWYRYAKVDPMLSPLFNEIKFDFLIYNRAWSGTREYRLKIVELLQKTQLHKACNSKFNAWQQGIHYTNHNWHNHRLKIDATNLEDVFDANTFDAYASADYCASDYLHSGIEVVLETLFDDTRQHLTEKTLRPIACGRPFILTATAGSLDYLRSYGFKTFAPYINENYDKIQCPLQRLEAIVAEMQRLSSLTPQKKLQLWQNVYAIAEHNKKHFFSADWQQQIWLELKHNVEQAIDKVTQGSKGHYWNQLQAIGQSLNKKLGTRGATEQDVDEFSKWLNQ